MRRAARCSADSHSRGACVISPRSSSRSPADRQRRANRPWPPSTASLRATAHALRLAEAGGIQAQGIEQVIDGWCHRNVEERSTERVSDSSGARPSCAWLSPGRLNVRLASAFMRLTALAVAVFAAYLVLAARRASICNDAGRTARDQRVAALHDDRDQGYRDPATDRTVAVQRVAAGGGECRARTQLSRMVAVGRSGHEYDIDFRV